MDEQFSCQRKVAHNNTYKDVITEQINDPHLCSIENLHLIVLDVKSKYVKSTKKTFL